MGNIFSKTKSTKATLKELTNKILEAEKTHKRIIKAKNRTKWRMVYFSMAVMTLSTGYAYIDEQNIAIFLILSVGFCLVFFWALCVFFSYRIESSGQFLEELKEERKELVNRLKTDEDFMETVELVDKFEEDSTRQLHFSRIQQKSKGVLDTVTDVVLGGDPSKLYALICKECHYHNGMVPPSEYKQLAFVCYNCNTLNQK
ncbi:Endoplasmic reticulum junction formation protein lunapark-1 [Nosema granulosis]|uniref:Endoplasmic reticulum junction formation protein lunapark n=1 Tax=Nosema granulosis TaxID=83296 RepID=A0A9P6H0W1_9MICR|nr:Endoplasmic reticulum junction formation protein lunapark-1 [Nosema granulosis]